MRNKWLEYIGSFLFFTPLVSAYSYAIFGIHLWLEPVSEARGVLIVLVHLASLVIGKGLLECAWIINRERK